MFKNKLFSVLMAAMLATQLAVSPLSAAEAPVTSAAPTWNAPLSIAEKTPDTNLLTNGDFDEAKDAASWVAGDQKKKLVTDANGGYMEFSNIVVNYTGFTYKPVDIVPAGNYKFTFYIRTKNQGALTTLRVYVDDALIWVSPTDQWMKVETYVTLANGLKQIKICGGPDANYVQSYCVDGFCLEKVDTIPSNVATEFGTKVSGTVAKASDNEVPNFDDGGYEKFDLEADGYEVQGVIINQDADSFISGCNGATEQQFIDYAKGFSGSHCTDYMICLNNTNATFKSETWMDLDDKYHQTVENGQPVNYTGEGMMKAAHYMYCVAKLDYIKTWCEVFPEVGINPWLSFRMNDAHDLSQQTSRLLSDYFHEHKEIRRVQNGCNINSYYNFCQDYQYELVRNHMLDLINDALSLYDPYGIELDWQREIWLWHQGGEYEGIEILNGFMRDVEALVAKYEEKYGHEIKIGVRVASHPQTNYDMGLDLTTWAAEGILDMVAPSGRWSSTDSNTPVALWTSIFHPYGVEVWPNIETNINQAGSTGKHTYETYCGYAANYLSEGADKVYLFNYYRGVSSPIRDTDKVILGEGELGISSAKEYFNVISTIGSYDKLMTKDRQVILTYNDTKQIWVNTDNQLPKNIMANAVGIIRVPMGDIPRDAEVYARFSVNLPSLTEDGKRPIVYVNGYECEFAGKANNPAYTSENVLSYKVPSEAFGEMYATIEIKAVEFVNVKYAEVYVKAPEKVDNSKITSASNTPSSWATEEVNAAIELGIVPEALQSAYRDTITRAEFCKLIMQMINEVEGTASSRLLLKAKGIEYADNFIDTDNPDIIAANLLGILNGRGNGIFDPNSGITRQEAAVMLANAAKVLGIKAGTAPTFKDMDKAASWAADAIKTVTAIKASTGNNVMNGTGNDEFSPLATYTREQSVLTVYRLYMAK